MQVDSNTAKKVNKITNAGKQANGCPVPATWFTLVDGSSCSVVRKQFQRGDEFADHTLTHKELTDGTSESTMTKEILGSRKWLVNKCGLPADSVKGFRSPYLTTNKRTRQVKYCILFCVLFCFVTLSMSIKYIQLLKFVLFIDRYLAHLSLSLSFTSLAFYIFSPSGS